MGKVTIDRRFLRQCDVPGCRSRDTVRIRRSTGYSEQLYMCKSCIKEAFELIYPAEEQVIEPENTDVPGETIAVGSDVTDESKASGTPVAPSKKKGAVKK